MISGTSETSADSVPQIEGAPPPRIASTVLRDLIEDYRDRRSLALRDARKKTQQIRTAVQQGSSQEEKSTSLVPGWNILADKWEEVEEKVMRAGMTVNVDTLLNIFQQGLSQEKQQFHIVEVTAEEAKTGPYKHSLSPGVPATPLEEESRWEFCLAPLCQDSAHAVFLQLAREWSHESANANCLTRTSAFTCGELMAEACQSAHTPCSRESFGQTLARPLRVLVPGCGTGRIAYDVAAALPEGSAIHAMDASLAMLVAFRAILRQNKMQQEPKLWRIYPGLLADPNSWSLNARSATASLQPPNAHEVEHAANSLHLHLSDFLVSRGSKDQTRYDAVVTVYFLDAVASLPEVLQCIVASLRSGGIWIQCGADPLRFLHPDAGHFSWDEMKALAFALGFRLVKEESFVAEYMPHASQSIVNRCICFRLDN